MKDSIMRLIIRTKKTHQFFGEWRMKTSIYGTGYGKPTPENLSKWRDGFNQSLQPGGSNAHLGMKYWLQTNLEIYNQITGQVICEYTSPAFEVIP